MMDCFRMWLICTVAFSFERHSLLVPSPGGSVSYTPSTANTCSSSVRSVHAFATSSCLSGQSRRKTYWIWRPRMPPFLLMSSTNTLMIFSSSPWVLSMNCSRHLKSTTANAILIDVLVTPRNESVSSADDTDDDAPDEPVDAAFLLSLLHALTNS